MPLMLTITTPEGLVYQGAASSVVVPAYDGELGILPRHAPLIGRLGVGELRVKPATGGATLSFFISGGFLQVLADRVVVLATRSEPTAAIDRARAEEELRRLRAEQPPPHSKIEVLDARRERLHAAQVRLKLATRTRAAG